MNVSEFELEQEVKQIISFGLESNNTIMTLHKICGLNNWAIGEVWLPVATEDFMKCEYTVSRNNKAFADVSRFSAFCKFAKGVGFIGQAWITGDIITSEDVSKNHDFLRSDIVLESGLKAVICIPALYREEVGAVCCYFLEKLTQRDLQIAKLLHHYSNELGTIICD